MFFALLYIACITCRAATIYEFNAIKMVGHLNEIVLGKPDNQRTALRSLLDCIVFSSGYCWKSFFYQRSDGFCQRNAEAFNAESNWEPGNGTILYMFVRDCPTGDGYIFTKSIRFCYKIHEVKRTWPLARQICCEEGGDLVSLETQDKYNQVVTTIKSKSYHVKSRFYVGARRTEEGDWRWVNGKNLMSNLSNWADGEPNNEDGMQDYVVLSNRKGLKYDDFFNDDECYFLCEISVWLH